LHHQNLLGIAQQPPIPRTVLHDPDSSQVEDLTFRHDKAGTPSPWAVFDAWGAGADICDPLSPSDEAKLTSSAVKIPLTADERLDVPGETDILQAYDRSLQQKSSVHLGYPYNLM
jgi:hypothetical protein